jgi:colanic acid biosynthesis glycosyl transferase WcaI
MSSKPRVVFFNRSYWPDVEATGQLLTELLEDLSDDFDVEVIAGQPNSVPTSVDYQRSGREIHNDVTITRLWHTQFRKHSFVGRILNLVTFTLSAAWTSLTLRKVDVVVTETDPFLLAFVGRWIQWWHRARFVVYLQDIYPDIAVAVGKLREGWISRVVRWMLFRIYRRADCVVVLSRDMEQTCRAYGVSADSLRIIPNWADTARVQPHKEQNQFRSEHGLESAFVVMYSGNMGLAHTLTPILDAADALRDDPRICFALVGDGARRAELAADTEARGLKNIRFFPYQPREQLAHSLSAADVHLIAMQPEATGFLMPSKLYGILASGSAVIALADPRSELAELIQKRELGFVCDPRDPHTGHERLAYVIHFLAENPKEARTFGNNARRVAEAEFDRSIQTARFAAMLHELIETAPIPETIPAPAAPSTTDIPQPESL